MSEWRTRPRKCTNSAAATNTYTTRNFGAKTAARTCAGSEIDDGGMGIRARSVCVQAPRIVLLPVRRTPGLDAFPATAPVRRAGALPGCRLGRGELAVHETADGEELRAIELAGQRVSAAFVDPVEHADAILDRVAEGGLLGAGALLAHLQREALLVRVLVHEERRRIFVAGHET